MKLSNSKGFALPAVLVSSIVMLIVMLSAVTSAVAIRVSLDSQYYNQLARTAGDAGVAYAKACIATDVSKTPQWTDAKPLRPGTDCSGNQLSGFTCSDNSIDIRCLVLVTDNNKTTSTFSVSRPVVNIKGEYKDIHATGYVRLIRTSGEIWRSYSSKSDTPVKDTVAAQLPVIGTPLANCTWEQIGAIADQGKGDDYFNIGDTKDMTLNTGEVLTMQIYDFNHDDKSDGTGKANITFGMKDLMISSRQYNSIVATNEGGWESSNIRDWVNNVLYNTIPNAVKGAIRNVNKKTSVGSVPINTPSSIITTSVDKLFLFSEIEIMSSLNMASYGEGTKYPIFTDVNSRIKHYKNGPDVQWWTRSPTAGLNTSSIVLTQLGSSGTTGVQSNGYINFGFALGNAPQYNINFNSQGGSAISTQNLEINKTVTKPTDPTKASSIFQGWYKEASYVNAWNFTTDKVTADTTLYAKWMSMPAIGTPLESFTWDQIAYISEHGLADTYFDVGNTKNITLSTSEVVAMQIYDFNHDDKSDGSGKAGITFGTKGLMGLADVRPITPMNINQGGWAWSDMRAYFNGVTTTYQNSNYTATAFLFSLPSDLQSKIVSVKKYSSGGNENPTIVTTVDKLFLFSDEEVFADHNFVSGEGSLYPVFTDNASRIKNNTNNYSEKWWLRSTKNNYNLDNNLYLLVNQSGLLEFNASNSSFAIVFGFCI